MDAFTARNVAASLMVLATVVLVARTLASTATTTPPKDRNALAKRRRSSRGKNQKSPDNETSPQYVTGLVNVGNTCFMNAVLQALASLPSLKTYLEARKEIGHAEDSVTLVLFETIEMLNIMHRRPTAKRLVRMVNTVKTKAAHVLTSQQQDAQELFQILSSQLSEEREKLDHPGTPSLLDRSIVSDILEPLPSSPSLSASITSSFSGSLQRKSSLSVMSSSLSLNPAARGTKDSSILVPSNDTDDSSKHEDHGVEFAPMTMSASWIMDRSEQDRFSRAKSPFMGLLASRVSCVDCGYTAAIRHSTFDNLSLTVPLQYSCSLEDCLDTFIHLDTITDFNCRKCSVLAASKDLERKIVQGKRALGESENRRKAQVEKLLNGGSTSPQSEALDGGEAIIEVSGSERKEDNLANNSNAQRRSSTTNPSTKPRISLAEMEKWKAQIDYCLAHDIEMDLSPLELTPVRSKSTTKHSMIAKPPQALCLHLNRSMFTASGQMAKNPCRVVFGDRLDFTRFTTSGHLTTVATKSMSRRGSVVSDHSQQQQQQQQQLQQQQYGVGSSLMLGTDPGSLGLGTTRFIERGGVLGKSDSIGGAGASNRVSQSSSAAARFGAESIVHAKASDDDTAAVTEEDRVMYRLWAVIVHLGSHNSGHFVTYRRIPSSTSSRKSTSTVSDKWWRVSDEDVQIVEWSIVKNAEAYMLFFEKES